MDVQKIKKDWEHYCKETEENDVVDIDLHYSTAMKVGGLIGEIERLQVEVGQVKAAYDDRVGDIEALEKSLREIDTHIRSTSEPTPHVVEVLKATLPEYQKDI